VEEMIEAAKAMFNLLDEVERGVVG